MIENAKIHFNAQGAPISDSYDDIYFDINDGLTESDYTFFGFNNIGQRWPSHDRRRFVIAESGFGTGLNFLNTWLKFRDYLQHNPGNTQQLHFISFEKYPLKQADLASALALWQSRLGELPQLLSDHYPPALPGCHRLSFDQGRVTLDLWFGDIQHCLAQFPDYPHGIVDAWYLDGFAPSKNPEMWQQALFDAMANLSRQGATLATFTAAGFVRRGLQAAGFRMQKGKGFGIKRELLFGQLPHRPPYTERVVATTRQAWRHPLMLGTTRPKVAIIGAGMAACSMAYSLAKRGVAATLFCEDHEIALGASKNRQGALYPLLQNQFNPLSEFYSHGFLQARRNYDEVAKLASFDHDFCGVLLEAHTETEAKRLSDLAQQTTYPNELFYAVDQQQAFALSQWPDVKPGIFFAQGGWLAPRQLCSALLTASAALLGKSLDCHLNSKVTAVSRRDNDATANPQVKWQVTAAQSGQQQRVDDFDVVIFAAGHRTNQWQATRHLAIRPVRGQINHLPETTITAPLRTVLCGKGYFTPSHQAQHCYGATFVKDDSREHICADESAQNWQQLHSAYPSLATLAADVDVNSDTDAIAGIRATSSDHLPMVGSIADVEAFCQTFAQLRFRGQVSAQQSPALPSLYSFTGLGARGLCSAPLAAELLCAEIFDEPYPVATRVLNALHPERHTERALKRREI